MKTKVKKTMLRVVWVIHGSNCGVEVFTSRKAAVAFRDNFATSFDCTRQVIRSDRWAASQIRMKNSRW